MLKNTILNKSVYLLTTFFFFFYIFNYLTPMCFGDDYVYSFIWQGHSEYNPLTMSAMRVSSFQDLLTSQWSHYFTWSGRTVSHIIAQFFLWMGKDIFNIFNALISVLLIMEIYWCANKGTFTLYFEMGRLTYIFIALWVFTLSFSSVFFWLSAASNYLWTSVLLLGFLLPYIHKYYFIEEKFAKNNWFWIVMFFFGIITGWTNENSICWIILVLLTFVCVTRKKNDIERWMIAGLTGLCIGYAVLMFAPGNVARLQAETGSASKWITSGLAKTNFRMLAGVFCFQFILWYFSLRSMFIMQYKTLKNDMMKREIILVQILAVLSFSMTAMMLVSPNFPPRSSFPGTVQLITATTVLLRIQEEYGTEIIQQNAKKFLCVVGSIYFVLSAIASFYGFYNYHVQVQQILSFVKYSEQAKTEIVTVPSVVPVSENVANMSGLHILYYEMSDNENDWRNVAFSRYYGIKGIRMIKSELDNPK